MGLLSMQGTGNKQAAWICRILMCGWTGGPQGVTRTKDTACVCTRHHDPQERCWLSIRLVTNDIALVIIQEPPPQRCPFPCQSGTLFF